MKSSFLYLASQSPRRRLLLEQIGVRHQLLLAPVDANPEQLEVALTNETARAYVQRVTALKLRAAMQLHQTRGLAAAPILCADTTVALGRSILGKPQSPAHARDMLAFLSGREHRVLTAVAVARNQTIRQALCESRVCFDKLDMAWIKRYVASGEPIGKAGAYAVQGCAASRITRIQGSYSAIMGLPLYETAKLIQDWVHFKGH